MPLPGDCDVNSKIGGCGEVGGELEVLIGVTGMAWRSRSSGGMLKYGLGVGDVVAAVSFVRSVSSTRG